MGKLGNWMNPFGKTIITNHVWVWKYLQLKTIIFFNEICIKATVGNLHIGTHSNLNPTCSNHIPRVLSRLSPEERAQVEAQLDELTATYNQLCDSSNQQLQQLEQQLAKEEERKVYWLEGWAEMEREHCRFMTRNVFLAFASLTKCNCEGTFFKMLL